MRIGFDAKRAFFNLSGLGNYSRNTIRQISRAFPDNQYFLYIPGRRGPVENDLLENQNPVYPASFAGRNFPSLWRSFWLGSALERDGIDLYHGLSGEIPFGIHRHNIRTVVTVHDLIFIRYPEWYRRIDRMIYTRKAVYACSMADRVIAISEQTRNDITKFFGIPGEKISVIYQGCDPAFYIEADSRIREAARGKYALPERYLLYVGTVEPRKNLLNIVKALQLAGTGLHLVVIGKPTAYARTVRQYISDHAIQGIHFIDRVPNQDLPAIFQMAEIFIYPSLFEGFGIPILEALSSGTPVITSRGGCFPEAGGPGSCYIDPEEPGEIANAVSRITGDASLRKTMSEKGREYAGGFGAESIASGIMDVYRSVMRL